MHIPDKYLHDKFILLLISINVFLAFLCLAVILLRIGVGQGSSDYIVQYRANLGISAFKSGSLAGIASFGLFTVLILATNILLSMRTYHLHRKLSVAILSLSAFLLAIAIIVSNSLLALR